MLDRCLDFAFAHAERAAQRVVEGDGVRAFLDLRIPLVWNANWMVVERDGMSVEEVVEQADQLIGESGMEHRVVLVRRPEWGPALAAGLERRGWDPDRGEYMVLREPWQQPATAIEIEEATLDEVAGFLEDFNSTELLRHIPEALVAETVPQLLMADRFASEAVERERWLVARADGRMASACRLFQQDRVGQVEDVATLPWARERGLARAVVCAAAAASRADGDELTFLGADANDWPKLLYASVGFETVGTLDGWRLRPGS
jgi:ribosomal protein S18 acetylase RimI-like enzyme